MSIEQPIDNVVWKDRGDLCPNDYNPNSVSPPELRLLKISILEDGWTQPIVINNENMIIDGFHRWTISKDKEISSITKGKVPCVVLNDADKDQRMMATIRHNRARGTHAAVKMSDIVSAMVKSGVKVEEIMERLQMEKEEVIRLTTRNGIPKSEVIKDSEFSSSWRPK